MKFLFLLVFSSNLFSAEDVVLKAMNDELVRTVNNLEISNFPKPYFVAYQITDSSVCSISASFGDIKDIDDRFIRYAKVDVRIGNNLFDSSNFIEDLNNRYEPSYSNVAVEDDYDLIRQSLWSLSDTAYKNALDSYSRKEAYRKKKDIKENYGDLTVEKSEHYIMDESNTKVNMLKCDSYKLFLSSASGIFKKYPFIKSSDIYFTRDISTDRFINSQDTSYKKMSSLIRMNVNTVVQDSEGYEKNSSKNFIFVDDREMNINLLDSIEDYAKELSSSYNSKPLDYYIGPAVFEDDAAAEFFNTLFIRNISFYPLPETENEDWLKYYYDIPLLVDRKGRKVVAGFIDITDDPFIKEYNGKSLVGGYDIDDEGVVPSKLVLVKNGILNDIYSSRRPSKFYKNSNGHSRGTYRMFNNTFPSNVFIKSAKTLNYKKFMKEAMGIAKDQNIDKILVIKKLSSYYFSDESLPPPSIAYLLDIKTGKKEYLSPSKFDGISLRALRDITYTEDKEMVYNFLERGPFYYNDAVPASIVCPRSVLVSEVELIKSDVKPEKKPYISRPYFER
ncbi:MAG: hypothetical protein KA059_00140 [Elusimicrobiales bacterium]|jgi:TldD protein|nr:hypothetical protein [Elusimicrobiales bacterium]